MVQKTDISEIILRFKNVEEQLFRIEKNILDTYNLKFSEINILYILKNEPLTISEVSEKGKLEFSTISRQINSAVEKDLVVRLNEKRDRKILFEITKKGKEIFNLYFSAYTEQVDALLKNWSEEEKHMLNVLLGRMRNSFSVQ